MKTKWEAQARKVETHLQITFAENYSKHLTNQNGESLPEGPTTACVN